MVPDFPDEGLPSSDGEDDPIFAADNSIWRGATGGNGNDEAEIDDNQHTDDDDKWGSRSAVPTPSTSDHSLHGPPSPSPRHSTSAATPVTIEAASDPRGDIHHTTPAGDDTRESSAHISTPKATPVPRYAQPTIASEKRQKPATNRAKSTAASKKNPGVLHKPSVPAAPLTFASSLSVGGLRPTGNMSHISAHSTVAGPVSSTPSKDATTTPNVGATTPSMGASHPPTSGTLEGGSAIPTRASRPSLIPTPSRGASHTSRRRGDLAGTTSPGLPKLVIIRPYMGRGGAVGGSETGTYGSTEGGGDVPTTAGGESERPQSFDRHGAEHLGGTTAGSSATAAGLSGTTTERSATTARLGGAPTGPSGGRPTGGSPSGGRQGGVEMVFEEFGGTRDRPSSSSRRDSTHETGEKTPEGYGGKGRGQ